MVKQLLKKEKIYGMMTSGDDCMSTNASNTPDLKKHELYDKQVETLKLFLERHAISQEQYDKSFHDLTEKMGFTVSSNEE